MSFSFPFLSSSKPTPSNDDNDDDDEECHLGNHPRNGTKITRYEAPPISTTHIDASNPPQDLLHPHHLIMDISSSSGSGSGGSGNGSGNGNGNGSGSGPSRNGSASSSPDTTKRRSTTLPEPTGLGMGRSPSPMTTTTTPATTTTNPDSRRTSETAIVNGGLGLVVETASELGSRSGSRVGNKKKKKVAVETFIIVRPPPSNSKRPLNLQIQLVMSRPGLQDRSASSSSSIASRGTNTSIILPTTPPVVVDDSPVNIRAAEHHEDDEDEAPTTFHPSDQLATSGSQTTGSRPTTSRTLTDASPTPKKIDEENARRRSSIRSDGGGIIDLKTSNRRMSTRSDGQDHTSDDEPRSTALESFPPMSRSESMSSSVSTFSSTSSSGSAVGRMSLSSLGMGGGKGSSRKIVPLYNLAVHNVMTTVVTDAGTEAKVAKFLKRSIDIANVGSLEAIEYRTTSTQHFLDAHSQPLSAQSTRSMAYIDSAVRGNNIRRSVDLSRLNVGVIFGLTSKPTSKENNASVPAPMPSEGRGKTRKFLNNLFRAPKLNDAATTPPPSGHVADRALSPVGSMFPGDVTHSPLADSLYYGAPTFGTSPGVVGPDPVGGLISGSRPLRYAWTIKRWSAAKGGSANNNWVPGVSSDDTSPGEVVFTWQRGRSAKRRQSHGGGNARRPDLIGVTEGQSSRKGSVHETGSDVSTSSVSASANMHQTSSLLSPGLSETSRCNPALSPDPRSKSRPVSMMSVSAQEDESDSDPEDSETPWTCSIRVPSGPTSSKGRKSVQRSFRDGLTVATMHPTPHHPRVVAQLKLPLELPTIATGLTVSPGPTAGPIEEIMLTEENVKDCVFVTALWLAAREEFGGIGRKKKV